MQSHIKTVHEGLREFECKICGKFFSTSSKLKKHKICFHRIDDSGNEITKEYKCDTCEKIFADNYKLNREASINYVVVILPIFDHPFLVSTIFKYKF